MVDATDQAITIASIGVGVAAVVVAWLLHISTSRRIDQMRRLGEQNLSLVKSFGPAIKEVEHHVDRLGLKGKRERLPDERKAITHHFKIGGHDGYVTVGLYPDGRPGEVFFRVTKEGSTVSGLMDSLGISMSMALQHGVPLKELIRKLAQLRFEPAGATNNPKVRFAKSIPDYVARWLAMEFLSAEDRESIGILPHEVRPEPVDAESDANARIVPTESDWIDRLFGPPSRCHVCGGIAVRSGSAIACTLCGATRASN